MGLVKDQNPRSVEEDDLLKAPVYERPLRISHDSKLDKAGGWRFTYKSGAIDCSHYTQHAELCRMSAVEVNTIGQISLPFVYLDVGRWGGSKDLGRTPEEDPKVNNRSFGIVSGQDVYLCYLSGKTLTSDDKPKFRNPVVDEFMSQLWNSGCKSLVYKYARAPRVDSATENDKHIYVLIPDFHLPPFGFYFNEIDLSFDGPRFSLDPPMWFQQTGYYATNSDRCRRMYGLIKAAEARGELKPSSADIFASATHDLVQFLSAIAQMKEHTRAGIHLINMGDMFELWLDRGYLYKTQGLDPQFIDSYGPGTAAGYAAEVILANMEIIEAHRALDQAGLAEVKYLWGNHDAYLMSPDVTSQLSLPQRDPSYRGLNGDLYIEHGHRFDSSNFDANDNGWFDGPNLANGAYAIPAIRAAEPLGRAWETLKGHLPERDAYFLGASLLYLYEGFAQKKKPFSIFCMGHTHQRMLRTFNISTARTYTDRQ